MARYLVSGAGMTAVDGIYVNNSSYNGYPAYINTNSGYWLWLDHPMADVYGWMIAAEVGDSTHAIYRTFTRNAVFTPDDNAANSWFVTGENASPAPALRVYTTASYTVSGAGTSGVNGTYTQAGTMFGYPFFKNGSLYLWVRSANPEGTSFHWLLSEGLFTQNTYYSGPVGASPGDPAELTWSVSGGTAPRPTVTAVVQPPICTLAVDAPVARTLTVTPTATAMENVLSDITIYWEGGPLGATTTGCVSGVPVSHQYPPAGGTFNVYALATDSLWYTGQSDPALQVVISANQSPVCSFVTTLAAEDHRTLTVQANTASSDPDGTITAWRYNPGDGSGWHPGIVGQAAVYTYAAHGTYTLTVEVTDNEGATAQETASIAAIDAAPQADCTIIEIDRQLYQVVDTTSDPDGAVTGITLDWGDDSALAHLSPGGTQMHYYPQPGQYILTYTAIDDDGTTHSITRSISMATIKKISTSKTGPLATISDTITIEGENLPLTGAVKIGEKIATVSTTPARSATSITITPAADTALGSQDVVLYSDAEGTTKVVSAEKAVVIYSALDTRDGSKVSFQAIDMVWIDGKCVGYAGEGMKLAPGTESKSYTPPNSFMPAATKAFLNKLEVSLKIDQVNGDILAKVLGGSYDDVTKMLTVTGDKEFDAHSIIAKDKNGNLTMIRAAVLTGGGDWEIGKKDFVGVETTWSAIKVAGQPLLEIYFA